MKKLLLLIITLSACKGRFVWVPAEDKSKTVAPVIPTLNQELAGVKFTFDDGPDLAKTPKVLDILKKYNLQAIFFVEGINLAGESEQAKERRALINRMVSEGHIVGNHTYDHKDLCRLSQEKAAWELDETSRLINASVDGGYTVRVVRPPYGKKCKQLTKLLSAKKLSPMYWDIDPREWERDSKTHQQKSAEQIIESIMAQYHRLHDEQGMNHMVVILHDTKKVTVELLPRLLERLAKEAITK